MILASKKVASAKIETVQTQQRGGVYEVDEKGVSQLKARTQDDSEYVLDNPDTQDNKNKEGAL